MGMPQTEMAKKLHVSRSTITRIISELRHEAGDWMEDLTADSGYLLELKTELDRLQDTMYNLIKLRNKETKPSVIIQINKEIANISGKRFELITKTSLAESLKKFVRKKMFSDIPGSNNKYGLPVLPEELEREDVKQNLERIRKRNKSLKNEENEKL